MTTIAPRPIESADLLLQPASREAVVTTARRTFGIGIFLVLLGALDALVFGVGEGSGAAASFTWNWATSLSVSGFNVRSEPVGIALGIACAVFGAVLVARPKLRYAISLTLLVFGGVATIFCLMMWIQKSNPGQAMDLGAFVTLSVSYATIIIFGSLAGTIGERSGVVNIAIEGQFLVGAFMGAVVGSAVANALSTGVGYLVGGISGIVIGGLLGALLAFVSLRFGANQIIVGVVLVALASGLTDYFNTQLLFTYSSSLNTGNVAPNLGIPLLDKIPVLGPAMFDQNLFAYLADLAVIALSFALFHTQWGLRVRAVGEHPRAAETVGIDVIRTRYKCVIIGGAIAGLGGAYYTLGLNGQFATGMTAGLGYIALATMIFGQWRPYRCFAAAVLFGTMTELGIYLSTYTSSLNPEYLVIMPYVVTIGVVAGLVGNVRPPAADGVPYSRE